MQRSIKGRKYANLLKVNFTQTQDMQNTQNILVKEKILN